MLGQFTVANYRSLRDVTTFSLLAADIEGRPEEANPTQVFRAGGMNLLKCAAIYGANGSGKSNLLHAFDFMKWVVLNSANESWPAGPISIETFKPGGREMPLPIFEIVFFVDDRCYRYGFKIEGGRILAEWLSQVIPGQAEVLYFERDNREITGSKAFRVTKRLAEKTRDNGLFLPVAGQAHNPLAQRIIDWFRKIVFVLDLGEGGVQPPALQMADENFIRFVEHHFDLDLSREQGELSGGTQKIVALTGPLLQVLNQGGILVIDELDVRLHPLITYRIVKLFASEVTNPQNAQLIFATHEAHLLSERLFRRDQVWFTEKDKDGATCLYSLVEFKMEKDRSFKHDYLSGRYGAIPIIWEIRSLGQVLDI